MTSSTDQQIRDYCNGRLTSEQQEAFELRLLEEPALAEATLYQQAFAELPTTRSFVAPSWLGLAAGLLLGAIGMHWLEGTKPSVSARANPTRIVFDNFRGEALPAMQILGSADATTLIVEIAVPTDAKEIYFFNNTNKIGPLVVDREGFVRVVLEDQAKPSWKISYLINKQTVERQLR